MPTNAIPAPDFTLAPVKGGWQIYDARHQRHVERVYRSRTQAQERLAELHRRYRAPVARFILTGDTV